MCNFFSCIVKKDRQVVWIPLVDSHDRLLEYAKLADRTCDPDKMVFARVEITPPNGDIFYRPLTDWTLKIDQQITPTWWSEGHAESARAALSRCIETHFLDGVVLDELAKGEIIIAMRNAKVGEMWENSQVGTMRETSQVGEMRENSRIGEMRENSRTCRWEDSGWTLTVPEGSIARVDFFLNKEK